MIKVPVDGLYFFYTESDDGSRLYIGDDLVVENGKPHAILETGGMLRLKAGFHPITVTFFERDGVEFLKVSYEGPGIRRQEIPPNVLFCTVPIENDPKQPKIEESKRKDRPTHAEDKIGADNHGNGAEADSQ